MSSITIRFPDGSREFRYPEIQIKVGDVLYREGVRYRVISLSGGRDGQARATVELVPEDLTDLLASEEGGIHLVPVDERVVALLEET